jgi:hypothetical protein
MLIIQEATKPFKNRSHRWDIAISQAAALTMKSQKNKGIPQKEYATQDECFRVAQKLARLVYEMDNTPHCPKNISEHLDQVPDKVVIPKVLIIFNLSKPKFYIFVLDNKIINLCLPLAI